MTSEEKLEIRMTKSEEIYKSEARNFTPLRIRISLFGFVSNFVFRISDLDANASFSPRGFFE
jgi:hypothetical protein